MDAAAAFLHRRERRAIARRRKGEPLRALVPVVLGDGTGLLAITPARVLYASRRRWRTPVRQWLRRAHQVRLEPRRYGIVHVGGTRLELMSRDDADTVHAALHPRPPPGAAMERPSTRRAARTSGGAGAASPGAAAGARRPPASAASPPGRAAWRALPDPLAHRGTVVHEARLRQLHAKGVLSKAELEWHLRG